MLELLLLQLRQKISVTTMESILLYYQTSTRALSNSILPSYHLTMGFSIFNPVGNYYPGAIYNHGCSGVNEYYWFAFSFRFNPNT